MNETFNYYLRKEKTRIKHLKNPKAFIASLQKIDDIY